MGFFKKSKYDKTKLKANLRQAVIRIKFQRNKTINHIKLTKIEVANLLKKEKDESARIKVENIIREDYLVEAFELLELFCDLLQSRIQLISESRSCPTDIKEAISTLIWSAPRLEIQELIEIRKQINLKYGKEFVVAAAENKELAVNQRVMFKLGVKVPDAYLCIQYLKQIAKKHNIKWDVKNPLSSISLDDPYANNQQQNQNQNQNQQYDDQQHTNQQHDDQQHTNQQHDNRNQMDDYQNRGNNNYNDYNNGDQRNNRDDRQQYNNDNRYNDQQQFNDQQRFNDQQHQYNNRQDNNDNRNQQYDDRNNSNQQYDDRNNRNQQYDDNYNNNSNNNNNDQYNDRQQSRDNFDDKQKKYNQEQEFSNLYPENDGKVEQDPFGPSGQNYDAILNPENMEIPQGFNDYNPNDNNNNNNNNNQNVNQRDFDSNLKNFETRNNDSNENYTDYNSNDNNNNDQQQQNWNDGGNAQQQDKLFDANSTPQYDTNLDTLASLQIPKHTQQEGEDSNEVDDLQARFDLLRKRDNEEN